MQNTIGIYLKLDPNSRNAFGYRFELELKSPQFPIILRKFALSLQDLDLHGSLVAHRVREHFTGFAGDCRISRYDYVHQPTECFNSERERSYIEQHDIPDLAAKHTGLDSCANRNCLIRVLRDI